MQAGRWCHRDGTQQTLAGAFAHNRWQTTAGDQRIREGAGGNRLCMPRSWTANRVTPYGNTPVATQVVPRLISQNAGFDSTDILNKLRQKHAAGGKYFGVDIVNDGICDTHETFVWEPSNIKQNAIVRILCCPQPCAYDIHRWH